MRNQRPFNLMTLILALGTFVACQAEAPEDSGPPHVVGGSDLERGRYLVTVGGCNDCHTEGYLQTEGNVPEDQWLLGSQLGWRGPWGTTYPRNLRLTVEGLTEDAWVSLLRERTALPPMPWMNVNQISEPDARSLYRYISSLGPAGEPMPQPVPPGVEPTTPYLSLVPIVPGG